MTRLGGANEIIIRNIKCIKQFFKTSDVALEQFVRLNTKFQGLDIRLTGVAGNVVKQLIA